MIAASLGEGNTPLVESAHAGLSLGLDRLFFKLESSNPTGSYKDRFIATEIKERVAEGARACVATSSGNTGSSLAAYCARYRLPCIIVVNDDAPAGKLEQMLAHRARVFRVKDFIRSAKITSDVFNTLSRLGRSKNIPLVVSAFRYCPIGMESVEQISRELIDQLGEVDHVFVPVGGGGLYSAVCRGFKRCGGKIPRVHAVQPSECSTVAAAFERGDDRIVPVESHTHISGLAVPFDIDAGLALKLLLELNGVAFAVADEEVFAAQRTLLGLEGIYCEPAGAAAFSGLSRAVAQGLVRSHETVVCLVTGHGFKDPEAVRRASAGCIPITIASSDLEQSVLEAV